MKKPVVLSLVFMLASCGLYAKTYTLTSPDGRLSAEVAVTDIVAWSLRSDGKPLIEPSPVSMTVDGLTWGKGNKVRKSAVKSVNGAITSGLYKKSVIPDRYSELTLDFTGGYSLVFRMYDDGLAYRWVGGPDRKVTVDAEEATFLFAGNDNRIHVGYVNASPQDVYTCSFEKQYEYIPLAEMSTFWPAFAPVLVELPDGMRVAVTEADLEDYPGLFLRFDSVSGRGLKGDFARYPLAEKQGGHNNLQAFVTQRAPYIARTSGKRLFPWRTVIVARQDRELLDNDMVYRLASPARIDPSWVKPGKLAWDYWNAWNIYDVDFRAGVNTDTYKFYIDFAAEKGLEYVLLDEGWADSEDIMKIVPEIDLPEIVRYAAGRGVSILLWGGWYPLSQKMEEAFAKYSAIGIKGFKVDFMDRDDQRMVNFYYDIARTAAKYKLIIDFHGAYKPTGLQRTYPNVVNFEGVYGMEYLKGDNPDMPRNDATIPFVRMLAGPLDYTPGAMVNATRKGYRGIWQTPMSQGTRAHQVALYVIFEAPLNMLADSPNNYRREMPVTDMIAAIPTVFDQTVALDGKVGEYAAIARRKGDVWYIGAITNWDSRELELDLSFLGNGAYEAWIIRDGVNADRNANDHRIFKQPVNASDKLTIKLMSGGGWAAVIRKEDS